MDRAQFLQGLRTGGPRSASLNQPFSASATTARFGPSAFQPVHDDEQQIPDMFQQMNLNGSAPVTAGADINMGARLQQQQQQLLMMQAQAQIAAMMASQGGGPAIEAQAMQMQMEIMRLQALQQQQNFQLMMQSQLAAQQQQGQNRRRSEQHQIPSTAGPLTSSFPEAMATGPSAAQTRMAAANQLRARAVGREATLSASVSEEPANAPMSAAVGGKFGVRAASTPLNPNAAAFIGRFNPELAAAIAASAKAPSAVPESPATPTYGSTTVISGGTSLGGSAGSNPASGNNSLASTPSNSYNGLSGYNNTASSATGPSKSDSAVSWRRGSVTPSTPSQGTPTSALPKAASPPLRNRSVSPPATMSSAPSKLSISSMSSSNSGSIDSPLRTRPSPLRFNSPPSVDMSTLAIARSGSPSGSADGNDVASANGSSKSSPTSSTPPSSASSGVPAREREEASKRLYEGLGIGRPSPSPVGTTFNVHAAPFTLNTNVPMFTSAASPMNVTPAGNVSASQMRAVSQPHRQPRGPPSGVDELGPRNFASRLRKKALGGLGVLMDARDRRESCGVMTAELMAC